MNQPEHVKVGTIKTLVRRAKILCCIEESLTDELDDIKKTMWLNGYPEKLITKTIKLTFSSSSQSKNSQNLETPKLFTPYENRISEQLNVLLINMFRVDIYKILITKVKVTNKPF